MSRLKFDTKRVKVDLLKKRFGVRESTQEVTKVVFLVTVAEKLRRVSMYLNKGLENAFFYHNI